MAYELIPTIINELTEQHYNAVRSTKLVFPGIDSCLFIVGIIDGQLKGVHLVMFSNDNTYIFGEENRRDLSSINLIFDGCSRFYIGGGINSEGWNFNTLIDYLPTIPDNVVIMQEEIRGKVNVRLVNNGHEIIFDNGTSSYSYSI